MVHEQIKYQLITVKNNNNIESPNKYYIFFHKQLIYTGYT